MKTHKITAFLLFSLILFTTRAVQAEFIVFTDTSVYWPGWDNSTPDDTRDTIGIPNFTGGTAVIQEGTLSSLIFNRQANTSSLWWALSPGDLFIDLGADQNWDYVVDLTSWAVSGKSNVDPLAGTTNVYSVDLALNSASGYVRSGADNSGDWSGLHIRDNHPVAASDLPTSAASTATFSGWGNNTTTQYSFDFDEGLDLGNSGKVIVSWAPNCANDVVYESLDYSTVPEPTSFLLFATGLAGAFFRRKIG